LYSVISVAYNLFMYLRLFHGTQRTTKFSSRFYCDISESELKAIIPLALISFLLFIFPNTIIKIVRVYFLKMCIVDLSAYSGFFFS